MTSRRMERDMLQFQPSPAQISIRLARQGDAEAISQMIVAALRAMHGPDYPPATIEAIAADFSPARLRSKMAQRKTIVAMSGSGIVGTAGLEAARVHAVFVAPGWQRQGIGSALMNEIEHLASCGQCSQIALWSGVAAQQFYTKRCYETLRRQVNQNVPTFLMRKSLVR